MLNQAQLLRACNELLLLLLGVFLIVLTFTGRYAVPRRSPTWIALGAFLMYWGLRAWARSGRSTSRWEHRLRGGSLALVGALMLAIAWLPLLHVPALLGAAGGSWPSAGWRASSLPRARRRAAAWPAPRLDRSGFGERNRRCPDAIGRAVAGAA